MDREYLKRQSVKINSGNKGIISFVSGSDEFKVGDKVKTRGDIGGFRLIITEIHNDHYCSCKGYNKSRHFNMCFLEHLK